MIDKITPRGLDKSSDHKLVTKTSMIDALNQYIADDYKNEKGSHEAYYLDQFSFIVP